MLGSFVRFLLFTRCEYSEWDSEWEYKDRREYKSYALTNHEVISIYSLYLIEVFERTRQTHVNMHNELY